MTPDINVLVASFRTDHPHHGSAHCWLQQARSRAAQGSHSLRLLPMVVAGFLRLVTNARVFADPDDIEDAVAFVDALLRSPGVELVASGSSEWPILRHKLVARGLRGNDVPDAWIAAAVEALTEQLVTFDRDFTRLLASRDLVLLPAGSS